jgi:hypothetical protein
LDDALRFISTMRFAYQVYKPIVVGGRLKISRDFTPFFNAKGVSDALKSDARTTRSAMQATHRHLHSVRDSGETQSLAVILGGDNGLPKTSSDPIPLHSKRIAPLRSGSSHCLTPCPTLRRPQ